MDNLRKLVLIMSKEETVALQERHTTIGNGVAGVEPWNGKIGRDSRDG
jgi:hypothetical protein